MSDREELLALRRMAELEAKASGGTSPETPKTGADAIPTDGYPKMAPPKFEEPSPYTLKELGRQVGLTGRYGLEGIGAGGLANIVGLPQPQGATERVVGDAARTMAGSVGLSKLAGSLAGASTPVVNAVMKQFATTPSLTSAAGAGAGSGIARENGAGEWGQLGAGLAGGIVAPAVTGGVSKVANWMADKAGNIGAAVGAARGNQRAINRLTSNAAEDLVGDNRAQIIGGMKSGSEFVPGVKPTVAEALAEQNMGNNKQVGGALIKMQDTLSGARGIEDVLPSNAKKQAIGLEDFADAVKAATKPMREKSLSGANVGGVSPVIIKSEIDDILSTPGIRASEVANKTLNAIKSRIEGLPRNAEGRLNADDLYTIRKEVGNTIGQFSKETANWDKNLTAGLEKDVQRSIDGAIERAGGTGWKDYLDAYSTGMGKIGQHNARAEVAKEIAKGIQGTPMNSVVSSEVPALPTLLSRPMMILNFALKHTLGDANTPVAKEMAKRMTDPVEFAKLIKAPTGDKFGDIAKKVAKQAMVSSTIEEMTAPKRAKGE